MDRANAEEFYAVYKGVVAEYSVSKYYNIYFPHFWCSLDITLRDHPFCMVMLRITTHSYGLF